MKKNVIRSLITIAVIATVFIGNCLNTDDLDGVSLAPTAHLEIPHFSEEANEIFIASLAGNIDLNSGITMDRGVPRYAAQINNITFAVFNHTNEAIQFPNQGFGLTVYRYDENKMVWEKLELLHMPYPEPTTVDSNVESWSSENKKTWTLLEDEVLAFGHKQLRLYISGNGTTTDKTYGAYLDIMIYSPP